MKAWHCRSVDCQTDYATIVFAETRGKAKVIAQSTGACEDTPFTEIECVRATERVSELERGCRIRGRLSNADA